MKTKIIESSYSRLLSEIKQKIQEARNQAYLAINKKMIVLYWEIGQRIAEKQKAEGWGTKVIQRLSEDLSEDAQDCSSFSVRNLKYMLKLYKTYLDFGRVGGPFRGRPLTEPYGRVTYTALYTSAIHSLVSCQ